VRAPFEGRIASRSAEVGQVVSPGAVLFTLVDDDALFARISVPERDAGLVARGMPAEVRIDALAGRRCRGEVSRIAPALDETTRNLTLDVALEDDCRRPAADAAARDAEAPGGRGLAPGALRPGMFAEVRLRLGHREQATTVPNQAIFKDDDGTRYVWTIADETAHRADVELGLRDRTRTEIRAGLPDDVDDLHVVIRGAEKLEEGAAVRPSAVGITSGQDE
jgi:multidrug efflux pump subunit AcrA (membrane-fusion protein)